MEQVGRKDNVLFVNDSKATNADSAAKALASFQDIFWIAGGKPKTGGHRQPDRVLSAHPQGLPDRRGRERFCEDVGRAGALRGQSHPVGGDRCGGARCAGVGAEGAGGTDCRRPAPHSTNTRTSKCAAKPSPTVMAIPGLSFASSQALRADRSRLAASSAGVNAS